MEALLITFVLERIRRQCFIITLESFGGYCRYYRRVKAARQEYAKRNVTYKLPVYSVAQQLASVLGGVFCGNVQLFGFKLPVFFRVQTAYVKSSTVSLFDFFYVLENAAPVYGNR